MKKAKIMLSAIAILAVVGGVFAYKAKSLDFLYYGYYTSTSCPYTLKSVTLTSLSAESTLFGYVTSVAGAECPYTTYYFNAN